MSAPYRRSSQHAFLWLVIVFSGIGCSIAIGTLVPRNIQWWWAMLAFMTPVAAAIALCVVLTLLAKLRRLRGIQVDLERADFVVDLKPDGPRKAAVLAPVAELRDWLALPNGADGIEWVALHTRQPSSVCIFEHSYITGSGRSTQEHPHTVMAWLVTATGINGISTRRPHRLQRRALVKAGAVVTTGDPRFDDNWLTFGNAAGAQMFFTVAMRSMLTDSPRGESWHVAPGWIACAFDGAMDARNLSLFRKRCQMILDRSGLAAYSEPNRHPFRWQNDTRSDPNRHLFRSKSAPLFRVS